MRVAIFVVVALFGYSEAFFKCKRNNTAANCPPGQQTTTSAWDYVPELRPILDLKPILSVEGICSQICNDCYGPSTTGAPQDYISGVLNGIVGGGNDGLLGGVVGGGNGLLKGTPAECLADIGVPITKHQACLFPCILNLNVLNVCNIQAILTTISAVCPNLNYSALCAEACACCGEDDQPLDLCVEVCLTHSQGSSSGINVPIIGDALPLDNVIPQDILPGLPGVNLAGLDGASSVVSGASGVAGAAKGGKSKGKGNNGLGLGRILKGIL